MEDSYIYEQDDRPLSDLITDEVEIGFLEGELLINEDIKLPVFVVNGVPYYD